MAQDAVLQGRLVVPPPRRPDLVTVASVVVPAHDEAAVVERCLEALLRDAAPGEVELVVAANGCTDDTAERARRTAARLGHPCTVLELATASKAAALQAADRVATVFPRVYVDADVVCPTATVRELTSALAQPGVELAVPRRELDLSGATTPARLYYRAWSRTPRVRQMLAGRGCYVLSRAARARFGDFPHQVADDRFVTTSVPRDAARIVDGAVTVFPPADLGAVLRVRTRIYAGNAQLGVVENQERGRDVRQTLREVADPREWLSLGVFGAVTALAKARARRVARDGPPVWGRDGARGGVARRG